DDDMAPNAQVHSSDDEDIENAYIPKASALASTYSPPPEDSLLAQTGDMAMFMDWFCKRQGITKLKPQDLEGPAFELVKKKKRRDSPKTPRGSPPHQPPPLPPLAGPSRTLGSPRAFRSSQVPPPPPPPTRKVSHMALQHQALQRQMPQLNIK
nr:hypothetical protein [Tanacetum cinerariifolium]